MQPAGHFAAYPLPSQYAVVRPAYVEMDHNILLKPWSITSHYYAQTNIACLCPITIGFRPQKRPLEMADFDSALSDLTSPSIVVTDAVYQELQGEVTLPYSFNSCSLNQ